MKALGRAALTLLVVATASGAQPPNSATEAVAALDVYPGMEAILFASEPMIGSPTNIDIDRKGRVWVCDVANYRAHANKPVRPNGDRILILEDTDGDGVADKKTLYYEGRDIDAALGICVFDDHVIVSCAPNILVFTDTDGDDKPDRKETLFKNTGRKQDDHSTHSVVNGPDMGFYFNFGNNGIAVRGGRARNHSHGDANRYPIIDRSRLRGNADWKNLESPYWGGMAFRFDLVRADFDRMEASNVRVLGHNFRNNYELAVDSFGNVWQTDNDDDGNYGCRINFVMEGGNFGYRDEITGAGWRKKRVNQNANVSKRHWHQNDPGVVPNLIETGAGSPTGITVYEGRLLPEAFWDTPIACDAGPGVVWGTQTKPDGAGFKGELVNLVKGERDKWFRPVDVAVAPDGSVFVSDWHDPHVGWNRQGDIPHGRIFRIAPKAHRYEPPDYEKATAAERLSNPNADFRILDFDDDVRAIFFESKNPRHRARALWRLCSEWQAFDNAVFEAGLKDPDPDIRMVALKAGLRVPDRRERGLKGLDLIRRMAKDPSPRVRRACALALQDYSSLEAARIWADLADQHDGEDRWYLEALGIGARHIWDAAFTLWRDRQKFAHGWTKAQEQIIWRSRSAQTADLVVDIVTKRDWDSQMGDMAFMRSFDFLPDSPAKQRALVRLATMVTGDDNDISDLQEQALLRIGRELLRDPFWCKTHEIEPRVEWYPGKDLALIEHLGASEEHPKMVEWALAHPENPEATDVLRVGLSSRSKEEVARLLTDNEDSVRIAKLLGSLQTQIVIDVLVSRLSSADTARELRETCVHGLAKGTRGIETMVRLAERGQFPEELKSVAGFAIKNTYNVGLHDRAAKQFPSPPIEGDAEIPQITDLVVYVGNAKNGARIFEKATCATCHVVEGKGISYGPDLSVIGDKLSRQALYEAILNPSAGISPTYQLHQFTLDSGEVRTGFVESESDSEIALRQPGGTLAELSVEEIAERTTIPSSAMPANLTALVTLDELVDLVSYLESLKGAPKE